MTSFLQSWLIAWVFFLCIGLGCLGILLLANALRARWGSATLRLLEAGARSLPLFLVLYLPVLANLPALYPWARPDAVAANAVLKHRAVFMNPAFFTARTLLYFVVWAALAYTLSASSRRQDRTGAEAEQSLRANIAAPGLVAYVLTVTFAFTDWVMSLNPTWISTIYGVWFIAGQALAALSLVTFIVAGGWGRAPWRAVAEPQLLKDLGNLMFAFTCFWTYISLSQYLIIWSADLPHETGFYLVRTRTSWNGLGAATVVGQFALPFFLLLASRIKRTPGALRWVAALVFALRLPDVLWAIAPEFRPQGFAVTPLDGVALVVVGVLFTMAFRWAMAGATPIPTHALATADAGMEAHHA